MAHSPVPGTSAAALSFTFSTQTLRVIMRDGEPWFVAADVCEALDVKDTSMACNRLDDDERGTSTVGTPSGEQQMLVINESGLYSLILTSRKPEAKKFKKWVTAEVLPTIRKTGQYTAPVSAPPASTRERLSGRDLMALRRVVWLIAKWFHHEQSWSNVVHKHLRLALGNPTPNPWHVDQLLSICTELTRIVLQAEAAAHAAREFEAECMRRLFKRGTLGELGAAELLATSKACMAREVERTQADLPTWLKSELKALTNRAQAVYMLNDARFDEQPETTTNTQSTGV